MADALQETHVNRRKLLKTIGIGSMAHMVAFPPLWAREASRQQRPNIIWIISEDMGPDLGCWGVSVHTPNIDQLAKDNMRFTRVFGTASVCMPNRTAMITGVTQTTLGSVTMRPPKRFNCGPGHSNQLSNYQLAVQEGR